MHVIHPDTATPAHQPAGISHGSDAGIRRCMATPHVRNALFLEVCVVSNHAQAKYIAKRSDLYQWSPSTICFMQ